MNKIKNILILLIFSTLLFSGDDGMEFGGYLENSSDVTFADSSFFSDYALIRIEGNYEMNDDAAIEAHIVLSTGSVQDELFAGMEDDALVKRLADEMGLNFEVDNSLDLIASFDRALIKLYFEYADVFIGRQQIGWGTGYAFNPTDVWNMKNPSDPEAGKLAVNALNISFPMGDLGSLSFILSPDNDMEHTSYGTRFKNNIFDYDYSFSLTRFHNTDRELYGVPEKALLGVDFSGQIIGEIGIFGEGVFVNHKYSGLEYTDIDSSYFQTTVGFDYTLDNGIYFMGEYHYNGLGKNDMDNYNVTDLINLYSGEMSGFGTNYIFFMAKYDFFDNYIFSINNLFNIDDKSGVIMPNLEYLFSEDISITINSSIFIGDRKKSEYGGIFNKFAITVAGYF